MQAISGRDCAFQRHMKLMKLVGRAFAERYLFTIFDLWILLGHDQDKLSVTSIQWFWAVSILVFRSLFVEQLVSYSTPKSFRTMKEESENKLLFVAQWVMMRGLPDYVEGIWLDRSTPQRATHISYLNRHRLHFHAVVHICVIQWPNRLKIFDRAKVYHLLLRLFGEFAVSLKRRTQIELWNAQYEFNTD